MMNKKAFKFSFLLFGLCTLSSIASADSRLQHQSDKFQKPIATVLPENGKLTDANGKLNQAIFLECINGKPGGISYTSVDNDLDVAAYAAVTVEIQVDDHLPVTSFGHQKNR